MRRPGSEFLLLLFALIGGCAERPPQVVPFPSDSALSWVFAVEQAGNRSGESLQLTAVEDSSLPVRFSALERSLRVYALGYLQPLSKLGLVPGAIPPAERCARSCDLLRPTRKLQLEFTRDQPSVWIASEVVEPALLDALVPDRATSCDEGCMSLTETSTGLGTSVPIEFLATEVLRADDPTIAESALLGFRDGSIHRIRGPLDFEPVCAANASTTTAGVFDLERQRLWVILGDGGVGWVDVGAAVPERPCPLVRTASVPLTAAATHVAVTRGSDPPELMILDLAGNMYRLLGAEVTSLGSLTLRRGDTMSRAGFVLQFGGATYFGAAGDDVAIFENGQLSHQRGFALTIQGAEVHSALAHNGDVYVAFGIYNLHVRRGGTGRFVPLDEGRSRTTAIWEDPEALAVLDGRLVSRLAKGFIGEWSQETSYCQTKEGFSPNGFYMANIQGSLYLSDYGGMVGAERRARWLTRDRPPACVP